MIDRLAEAAIRLDRIVAYVQQGPNGSFRTHLDEWAAYEFGGGLLTRTGRQRWFNNPCPWSEGERLLAYMDWFSFDAADICRRGVSRDPAVRKPKNGRVAPYRLIVEHVVPVRALREGIRADQALRRRPAVAEFLHVYFKRAVITKGENDALRPWNDCMPEGWQIGDDPFARYRAAGLV